MPVFSGIVLMFYPEGYLGYFRYPFFRLLVSQDVRVDGDQPLQDVGMLPIGVSKPLHVGLEVLVGEGSFSCQPVSFVVGFWMTWTWPSLCCVACWSLCHKSLFATSLGKV